MKRAYAATLALFLIAGCDGDSSHVTAVPPDSEVRSGGASTDMPAPPEGVINPATQFRTHLKGDEAGVKTNAQGQAAFHYTPRWGELHYRVIVSNIEDIVGVHIHVAPAGSNGPIVLPLIGNPFIEDPGVTTSGTLIQGTVTAADVTGPMEGDLEALVEAIRAGETYLNVHTVEYRSGEIRGQIW